MMTAIECTQELCSTHSRLATTKTANKSDHTIANWFLLTADPIRSTETLIASIIIAAVATTVVPPLAVHWDEFCINWAVYKRAQRNIYAIVIATLHHTGKPDHI